MKKYLLSLTAGILCCAVSDSVQSMHNTNANNSKEASVQSINNLSEEEILKTYLTNKYSPELTAVVNHLNDHHHLVDQNSSKLINSIEFCDPLETIKKIEDLAKEINRIDNELLTAQQVLNDNSNENNSNLVTQSENKIDKIKKTIDDLENQRNKIAEQLEISKEALREILEEKFDKRCVLPFTALSEITCQTVTNIDIKDIYYKTDRLTPEIAIPDWLTEKLLESNILINDWTGGNFRCIYAFMPNDNNDFFIEPTTDPFELFNHKHIEIHEHIKKILSDINSLNIVQNTDKNNITLALSTKNKWKFYTWTNLKKHRYICSSNIIIVKLGKSPIANLEENYVITAFPYFGEVDKQTIELRGSKDSFDQFLKSKGYEKELQIFQQELIASLVNHYWQIIEAQNYANIKNSTRSAMNNRNFTDILKSGSLVNGADNQFIKKINGLIGDYNNAQKLPTSNKQELSIKLQKIQSINKDANTLINLYRNWDNVASFFMARVYNTCLFTNKTIKSSDILIQQNSQTAEETSVYISDKALDYNDLFKCAKITLDGAVLKEGVLKCLYFSILPSGKYPLSQFNINQSKKYNVQINFNIDFRNSNNVMPVVSSCVRSCPDNTETQQYSANFNEQCLYIISNEKKNKRLTKDQADFLTQQIESGSLQKQIVAGLKNFSVYNDYLNESENNTRLLRILNAFNQNLQSKKVHLEELIQQKEQLNNAQSGLLERRKEDYEKDLEQKPIERQQRVADLQTSLNTFNQNIDVLKNVQTDWHNRLLSNKCFFAFAQERYVITSIFFPGLTNDPRTDMRKLFSKNNVLGVIFVYNDLFSENKHYNVILKEPFWMFVDYLDKSKQSYVTQSHTIRLIATFNGGKPTIISSFPKDDENYPTLEDHCFYVNNIASDYTEQK